MKSKTIFFFPHLQNTKKKLRKKKISTLLWTLDLVMSLMNLNFTEAQYKIRQSLASIASSVWKSIILCVSNLSSSSFWLQQLPNLPLSLFTCMFPVSITLMTNINSMALLNVITLFRRDPPLCDVTRQKYLRNKELQNKASSSSNLKSTPVFQWQQQCGVLDETLHGPLNFTHSLADGYGFFRHGLRIGHVVLHDGLEELILIFSIKWRLMRMNTEPHYCEWWYFSWFIITVAGWINSS